MSRCSVLGWLAGWLDGWLAWPGPAGLLGLSLPMRYGVFSCRFALAQSPNSTCQPTPGGEGRRGGGGYVQDLANHWPRAV